jgi:diadenylate cyclase
MVDVLEGLLHLVQPRPPQQIVIDVLDIVIVTWVIYRALAVLRGTRAMQMGIGLGVIALIYALAGRVGFVTLYNLLSTLLSSIILIVVVVFQNDIRRGLMRLGARAFFGGITREQESRVIDEVVAAATELARHRMGALICFEQDANLDEFAVGQGTVIDASVQRELLVGLFVPESVNKLHDGAVVIRNLRIAKAGVFFPMPDTKLLDKSLGSRHRAALGITEETDAVVVVVSEERGTIGFCFNGNIVSQLDGASLRQALLGLFGQKTRGGKKRGAPPPRKGPPSSVRPGAISGSTPVPSSPSPTAPLASTREPRDGNTGSVMLPRRDSAAPPPSGVPRPIPRVVTKTDPGSKVMPIAPDLPPQSSTSPPSSNPPPGTSGDE